MTGPLLVVLLAALSAAPPPAGELERQAREIDTMLVAPCCFRQEVAVHQSDAARAVKQDVRQRLAAGETQQEILDAYVAHYGKHILAEPRAEGFDRLLYVLPVVMFVASIAVLTIAIRRLTGHPAAGAPGALADAETQAEAEQLDDELRDLD